MAHLDFPANPVNGQKHPPTAVPGQIQYTWDGEKWMTYSLPSAIQGPVGPMGPQGETGPQGPVGPVGPGSTLPGPGTPIFSDTPPIGAADNSIWIESDTGLMFFRWNDGTSTQWVTLGTGSGNAVLVTPQALTSAQAAQARANIWVRRKNYVVNGAMQISQENGAAVGTASGYYPVDQYVSSLNGMACNVQQVAVTTPAGSTNRIRVTVTAAHPTVLSAEYFMLIHYIEGLRISDLRSGTAAAKTVTIQFGVKAPAGTYSVNIQNGTVTRSYSAEYVISAAEANTDVVKSVVIPLDTTGAWLADNSMSFRINWGLATGATYKQNPGIWMPNNLIASVNQSNMFATNGNVWELFDVSMTEGPVAPPFEVPDIASELLVCRRYFQTDATGNMFFAPLDTASTYRFLTWWFNPPMRANPTITYTVTSTSMGAGFPSLSTVTPSFVSMRADVAAAGGNYSYLTSIKAVAR